MDGDEYTAGVGSNRQEDVRSSGRCAVADVQSAGATEVKECKICMDAPVNAGLKHGHRYILPGVLSHPVCKVLLTDFL